MKQGVSDLPAHLIVRNIGTEVDVYITPDEVDVEITPDEVDVEITSSEVTVTLRT